MVDLPVPLGPLMTIARLRSTAEVSVGAILNKVLEKARVETGGLCAVLEVLQKDERDDWW